MNVNLLKNRGIAVKIGAGVVAMVLVFVAVLFGFVFPTLRARIYDEKRAAVRQEVESAYTLMVHYGSLAEKGQLSEEDARKRALEAIGAMRYDGDNYFWVPGCWAWRERFVWRPG